MDDEREDRTSAIQPQQRTNLTKEHDYAHGYGYAMRTKQTRRRKREKVYVYWLKAGKDRV